jgi:hypothetical protein
MSHDVSCIDPGNCAYDDSRIISNARFDFRPASICYCRNEQEVQQVLRRGRTGLVRIRSGGHQHEGMCSGDDVMIVDVSNIDGISIHGDVLTVGPGARLRDVYKHMWKDRRLLPGGGCGDVCVGGLVQGGGWGPYSRALGLTCDVLLGFRIVQADGGILDVSREMDDPHSELFWAVCGGGGGNFGVLTQFRFRLATLHGPITSFTVTWSDPAPYGLVMDDWRSHLPEDADNRLTTFCRLTARAGGAGADPPVVVAGFFLGEQDEIAAMLPDLLPGTYDGRAGVTFNREDKDPEGRRVFQHPEYQPGPPAHALRAMGLLAADASADLASTCAGIPFSHKVSSCYPRAEFGEAEVRRVARYLMESDTEPTARRYLSLHSLGGAIANPNDRSCFAYREKPFMMQYQAWWADADPTSDVSRRCLAWVAGFRDTMQRDTEGAFINFPDKDLPASDRKALLRYYYAHKLDRLIGIKATYDPGNLFDFPMGIPTC